LLKTKSPAPIKARGFSIILFSFKFCGCWLLAVGCWLLAVGCEAKSDEVGYMWFELPLMRGKCRKDFIKTNLLV
jgi:hypothetical protein